MEHLSAMLSQMEDLSAVNSENGKLIHLDHEYPKSKWRSGDNRNQHGGIDPPCSEIEIPSKIAIKYYTFRSKN